MLHSATVGFNAQAKNKIVYVFLVSGEACVCGQADKFPENAGITLLLYQMNWSRRFEYAGQCGTNGSQRFALAMVLYGRGYMLHPDYAASGC